ncbi:MAG: signal peptide peptidase SppA [Candidatus Methylacidiphilales bacterium]|nr:signal peptide peptidase SppA [Candidatus Methylacidiphilales bacterium]
MNNKVLGCLGIVLLAALGLSVLLNFALLVGDLETGTSKKTFQEKVIEEHGLGSSDTIAVLDLFGVITYGVPGMVEDTMVDDLVAKLKQAREDENIKAVVLRIDSPGGEVTASDVLYHAVAQTRATKPVIAYIDSVGASGAYYTAMGASKVMANELSITGSIGVIMQSINVEQLANKIGITAFTFKSGKMKDLLNPTRQPTPEEMAFVQGLINETYDKFVGIVSKERKLNEQALRAELADGRIVSGKLAAAAGLIDKTGYFEEALEEARKAGNLGKDARIVRLVAPFTFSHFLRAWSKAPETPKVQIEIGPDLPRMEAGKLYFLSPHLYGR